MSSLNNNDAQDFCRHQVTEDEDYYHPMRCGTSPVDSHRLEFSYVTMKKSWTFLLQLMPSVDTARRFPSHFMISITAFPI